MAGSTGIGITYSTYRQRTSAPNAPGANYVRLYFGPDGKLYYIDSNGTEKAWDPTAVAITGGTIDGATIGGTTAGTIRAKLDEDAEPASDTLSANQCSGGLISNYGQTGDVTLTLPAVAAGLHFTVLLGTTVAKYFRLDPNASEVIYLDGTALTGGYYVGLASAVAGACIQFVAFQTGASAWAWAATTISGAWAAQA